ncbi:hypothetical protein Taro_015763 [Colocasia esculenta]|uniref:Uncharacterized protein n=1 Tax=Colocasia esculenta TaxID=4460 RepID=A0A843UC57_COLES|nr:hypothetical protein [Colocasia esculenta]
MLPFTSWLATVDAAVYLQVVRGRLSRFEELCLSVVGLVLLLFIMDPRRCCKWRVVVQTSQQEARDSPPPPLAQPRPQDVHGGVVPPLPPQATQGFDWTPQLVGGSRPEHWQVLLLARVPDAVAAYLYAAAAEADFLQTQVQVGAAQAQPDLLWRVFLLAYGVEFFASGTCVLAYAVWSYRCRCGVAALPCLVQREQNFRELSDDTGWQYRSVAVLCGLLSSEVEEQATVDAAVYLQVSSQQAVLSLLPWFEVLTCGVRLLAQSARFIMAPRRCCERRVVVQTSQQEARDAPPPPLAQPRPQDVHGGVVPPLPPQATQGFDWTPQLVGGSRPEHWQVLLLARVPDVVAAYLYAAAVEADFLQTQVQVGAAQAQPDLLWRVFLLAYGVEFFASGTCVLAYAVWSYRCHCGVAALPCLGVVVDQWLASRGRSLIWGLASSIVDVFCRFRIVPAMNLTENGLDVDSLAVQVVDGSSWKDLGAQDRVRSGRKQRIEWRFSRESF